MADEAAGFGSCIGTSDDRDERVRDEMHDGSNLQPSYNIVHQQQPNSSNIIHQQQQNPSFFQEADESNWLDLTNDPLKLTLETTPPLLTWIQRTLAGNQSFAHSMAEKDLKEKLRTICLPSFLLRIGTWQKQSKHEDDLVAKCCFGTRKFVWEILEGPLKRKLETSWSNIIGLQFITGDGADILNLELNQPPSFGQEIEPKPGAHSAWKDSEDFTECQALLYRRHQLQFPPGNLEKLFNKLFISDGRLFKLSQTCFPTSDSPYFDIIRDNNNLVYPPQNSTVPMLQNVPFFSSNRSFTPDLHQLPPTNILSTLIPYSNVHQPITATRGGGGGQFSRSNTVTSDFNEEVGKDGVNIIDHYGRPQHLDNGNIIVGNHPTNILDQYNCYLPPLPVPRSGANTFETKTEISNINASQYYFQGTTTISSHAGERVNQTNEILDSGMYDLEATFLRGGTTQALTSLDHQQGRYTATDEDSLVIGEGIPLDYFSDPLHQSWTDTENYDHRNP